MAYRVTDFGIQGDLSQGLFWKFSERQMGQLNLKKSYILTFNLKKSYIQLEKILHSTWKILHFTWKSYILTIKTDISTWKNLTRNFREADYLPQNRARINPGTSTTSYHSFTVQADLRELAPRVQESVKVRLKFEN